MLSAAAHMRNRLQQKSNRLRERWHIPAADVKSLDGVIDFMVDVETSSGPTTIPRFKIAYEEELCKTDELP